MHYKIFKTVKTGKTEYYVQYQDDEGMWHTIMEVENGCSYFSGLVIRKFRTITKAKEYTAKFIKEKELANTPDVVVYEEGDE